MDRNAKAPNWPEGVAVDRIRIAKPTDNWDAVLDFYKDGLGLRQFSSFEDHDGYDGVMLGLPDESIHLEIIRHKAGLSARAPTRDNLLVLYFSDPDDIKRLSTRLRSHGHEPVQPENPYWNGRAVCFEDPDGWGLVLCNSPG